MISLINSSILDSESNLNKDGFMYQKEFLDDEYSESLLLKLKQFNLHDNETIINAMKFAKFYHKGQNRKSGEPYYMHPVAVAEMTLPYTKNSDLIASALMHDVVEDTIATIGMIEKDFGCRIAQMVDRLTRDRPDGSKLSVEIILKNACAANDIEVLLIKTCDRIHNARTSEYLSEEKKQKLVKETLESFLAIAICLNNSEIEKAIIIETNKLLPQEKKYNYYTDHSSDLKLPKI